MSGELEKWRGNLPARQSEPDRYVEEWRRKHGLPARQPQRQPPESERRPSYTPSNSFEKVDGVYYANQPPVAVPKIRDQVELLRWCGRRRTIWMAGYILVQGRWKFSGGTEIDALRQRVMYEDRVHDTYEFQGSNYDYETCGCCSTTGWGALECLKCGAFMCWGSTWQDGPQRWGRCPKCGQDGILHEGDSVQGAIYPQGRGR